MTREQIIKYGKASRQNIITKAPKDMLASWGIHNEQYCEALGGAAWSFEVSGLQYQGQIVVTKHGDGTVSMAKGSAFGRLVTSREMSKSFASHVKTRDAIDILDRWIERGDLSVEDYEKAARDKARQDLLSLGINPALYGI